MVEERVELLAVRPFAERQPRHFAVDASGNKRTPQEQRAGDHRLLARLRHQPRAHEADRGGQHHGVRRLEAELQQDVARHAADLAVGHAARASRRLASRNHTAGARRTRAARRPWRRRARSRPALKSGAAARWGRRPARRVAAVWGARRCARCLRGAGDRTGTVSGRYRPACAACRSVGRRALRRAEPRGGCARRSPCRGTAGPGHRRRHECGRLVQSECVTVSHKDPPRTSLQLGNTARSALCIPHRARRAPRSARRLHACRRRLRHRRADRLRQQRSRVEAVRYDLNILLRK